MGDGANLGITARRALGTILGGEDQPTEAEQQTPAQVYERVMATPSPCEGTPIWKRNPAKDSDWDMYSIATDCITKAFLLIEQEQPGILLKRLIYPDDYVVESLRGKQRDAMTAVWNAVRKKWPKFDDWIGGATGFMVGFAYNQAIYTKGQDIPPEPNPALLTIKG